MNFRMTKPVTDCEVVAPSKTLNLLVLYDGFDTGVKALSRVDELAAALGPRWRLKNRLWKFELLAFPEIQGIAGNDALAVDLVMVAGESNLPLPGQIGTWIGRWIASERHHPPAMCALLCEPDCGETDRLQRDLRRLARRLNMDFLVARAEPGGEGMNSLLDYLEEHEGAFRPGGPMTRHLNPYHHWGIND